MIEVLKICSHQDKLNDKIRGLILFWKIKCLDKRLKDYKMRLTDNKIDKGLKDYKIRLYYSIVIIKIGLYAKFWSWAKVTFVL